MTSNPASTANSPGPAASGEAAHAAAPASSPTFSPLYQQIKGLITYPGIGTHTASTTGTNGDTFQPQDVALMESKLPDAVDAPTAWVMRKAMFAALMNRRADAVSAAGTGTYFVTVTCTICGAGLMHADCVAQPASASAAIASASFIRFRSTVV